MLTLVLQKVAMHNPPAWKQQQQAQAAVRVQGGVTRRVCHCDSEQQRCFSSMQVSPLGFCIFVVVLQDAESTGPARLPAWLTAVRSRLEPNSYGVRVVSQAQHGDEQRVSPAKGRATAGFA